MNLSRDIPFEKIVQDAVEVVAGQIAMSGVCVDVASDLPIVHGDSVRLTQVLQNLIENAIKFMGDQPEPRIDVGQTGREDGKPIFYVRDNGIGISPEHHERILGLFDKLDGGSDGTGIGLALVKRIVEIHGGRIWVESEAGRGRHFSLLYPKVWRREEK